MATVIRVDPDDELPAILERLPSGAPCVVALPPHSRALSSAVGAKLLARRAETLGSAVAVVSDDNAVLAHVRAAGLPAVTTVDEAQRLLANGAGDEALHNAPTVVTRRVSGGTAEANGATGGAKAGPSTPPSAAAPDADDQAPDAMQAGAMRAAFTAGAGEAPATETQPDDQDESAAPQEVRGHSGGRRAAGGSAARQPGATRRGPATSGPVRPQATGARGVWDRVVVPAALVLLPLLVILGVAVYVLSGILNPTAALTVVPRFSAISATSPPIHASATIAPDKVDAYHVRIYPSNQAEKGTRSLPVRGVKLLPGKLASGALELGNLTTRPLFVPRGTTFTTALNAQSFVSTQDITLSAAQESFAEVHYGTGSVSISATLGGTSSNVPAGAIVNVPAQFAGALKVQNTRPTSGGTDIKERVVDPRDLAATAQALFAALEQQANKDIDRKHNAALEQHVLFVARSPVAPVVAPDHSTASLTLSVVVHTQYVRKSDLLPAATTALQPAINSLHGATYVPNSLGWTATWSYDKRHRQVITLAVTGRTLPTLDTAALAHAISGKSKAAAQQYLKGRSDLSLRGGIALSPPWADHLPDDVTRINITVQTPG